MVGGYGFQLSVSYRVLFDTVDRSLIGHYRTIAEIAGFQFFLHPQIEQHTNCDVFRLRNEFLFLIIIGAVNWGLIGFFQFDLVRVIFGNMSMFSRIIYAAVGLSGLYALSYFGRIRSAM